MTAHRCTWLLIAHGVESCPKCCALRPASGIETEGQDPAERLGAEHESPTAESGDAQ